MGSISLYLNCLLKTIFFLVFAVSSLNKVTYCNKDFYLFVIYVLNDDVHL